MMCVLDVRLALLVVLLGTCSVSLSARFSEKLDGLSSGARRAGAEMLSELTENMRTFKTIRLLHIAGDRADRCFDRCADCEAELRAQIGRAAARMKTLLTLTDLSTALMQVGRRMYPPRARGARRKGGIQRAGRRFRICPGRRIARIP